MAFGRRLEVSTASKPAPTAPDGSETVRLSQAGVAKESAINDLVVTPTGASTARSFASRLADVVNVEDHYGTAGDRTDAQAWAAAIAAAGTNGIIWAPDDYTFNANEHLEPLDGQSIWLGGWARKSSAETARTDNLVVLNGKSRVTFFGMGGGLGYSVGNHLAIYSTGVCDRITCIGVKFDRLLSFFERYCDNIRFEDCEFTDDGTALGAIAAGGLVNQTTGAVTIEPGMCRGLNVNGCYFKGFKDEAIDINCCTSGVAIASNLFDRCGTNADNEVIDVGGACVASATVQAGGTGYVTGDTVTVSGGNFSTAATFTVTASAGVVTSVALAGGGYYYRFPTLAAAATTTGGAGSNLTLNLTVNRCEDIVIAKNTFRMPAVEKRCIRLKWETRSVVVSGNVASFDSQVTTTVSVASAFVKIEQCDDVKVFGNNARNFYEGAAVTGPTNGVHINENGFLNVYKHGIGIGSLNSATDNRNLKGCRNTITMTAASANDEAIDANYCDDFDFSENHITLPTGSTTEDGIELRAGCLNGRANRNTFRGGNRGVVVNSSCTLIEADGNSGEGLNGAVVAWGSLVNSVRYQAATIASGVISPRANARYIIVDTEGAAASDDLDTITATASGSNLFEIGDRIIIQASSSSRTVVAKDATGNLQLAGDFTMDNNQDTLELVFSTSSVWREVGRSDNGA